MISIFVFKKNLIMNCCWKNKRIGNVEVIQNQKWEEEAIKQEEIEIQGAIEESQEKPEIIDDSDNFRDNDILPNAGNKR